MDELLQYNKTDYSKGIYYTPTDFFKDIIKKIEIKINSHIKILDFCCGTGNLFFALLENIKNVFDNNVPVLFCSCDIIFLYYNVPARQCPCTLMFLKYRFPEMIVPLFS